MKACPRRRRPARHRTRAGANPARAPTRKSRASRSDERCAFCTFEFGSVGRLQTALRQVRETFLRDVERLCLPSPHLAKDHTRPRATKSTSVVVPTGAWNGAPSAGDTACARTSRSSRIRTRRTSRRFRNPRVVIADDHPRGGDGQRCRDRRGGAARRRRREPPRWEGTTRSVPRFVFRGGPNGSPRKRARGGYYRREARSANLRALRLAFAS